MKATVPSHYNIQKYYPKIKKALETLEKTTAKKKGKYKVDVLWKNNNLSFQNDHALVIDGIINMERNFKRDPKFHEMCIATINDYIKQEDAVKVTSGKLDRPSNVISYLSVISYLPHHCVSNINKPGSVRVVFNTGAKFENTCPNVKILKEPDLLKKLLSVLLKFREGRYGILFDIQQMFHRVLKNHDQQSLRF